MFKYLCRNIGAAFQAEISLRPVVPRIQPARTTFVLKRRNAPLLAKKGKPPRSLRPRHFVYDLVEDTDLRKKENLDVILTSYVQGYGEEGDKVSVKPYEAYYKLLLPGLAVYASPENLEKYSTMKKEVVETKFSSPNAERIMTYLSKARISVVMNKETPWTIEPWHIRMSFRKAAILVPEEAIELPKEPIRGPDLTIERKYFPVVITLNNREKVTVTCFVHHWSTQPQDKLPWVERYWELPAEPVLPAYTTAATTTTTNNSTVPTES